MDSGNQVANITTKRWKTKGYRIRVLKTITHELIKHGSPNVNLMFSEVFQSVKRFEANANASAKTEDEYLSLVTEELKRICAWTWKTVGAKKKITTPSASEIDAFRDCQRHAYERNNMVSQHHRVAMPIGSSQHSIINQSSIVKGQSNAVKQQTNIALQEKFGVNNNAPRISATKVFGTRANTERISPLIKESNAVKQQANIALQEFGVNNNAPRISTTEVFGTRANTERISPLIKESNAVKQQTNIALQEFGVNNNAPRISATEVFGTRVNTERISPLIKESNAVKQQTNIALHEFGVNNNAPRISETEAFGTRTNTERILPLIKESNDQNQGFHNTEVQSHAMQKLIRALTSVSPKALSAAVGEIEEVVHLNDEMPEIVDEQGLPLFVTPRGWKMPRSFVATTFNTPSMCEGFNPLAYTAKSSLNSFTMKGKRSLTVQENQNLLAEIEDINNRLFDCEVVIAEKENATSAVGIATDQSEGLVVKILYHAVTINQNLVSHFTADKRSFIEPLRLLIPSSYPSCSLVILDEFPLKVSDDLRALSERAKEKLRFNLEGMNEPLLVKDIARVWERCAREAILEYARANGGGTFTSMYGGLEVR